MLFKLQEIYSVEIIEMVIKNSKGMICDEAVVTN
jgi:hypothetical protein